MTLNWGHKLILVFIAFGGMMTFLVVRSMQTNFDLVTKEYYKEELQYQQVIDGAGRAGRLSSPVSVQQEGDRLLVRFPEEMKQQAVEGQLWFYCSYNAQKDRRIPLELNPEGIQSIPAAAITPGRYTVRIRWVSHDESYYSEQPITIK